MHRRNIDPAQDRNRLYRDDLPIPGHRAWEHNIPRRGPNPGDLSPVLFGLDRTAFRAGEPVRAQQPQVRRGSLPNQPPPAPRRARNGVPRAGNAIPRARNTAPISRSQPRRQAVDRVIQERSMAPSPEVARPAPEEPQIIIHTRDTDPTDIRAVTMDLVLDHNFSMAQTTRIVEDFFHLPVDELVAVPIGALQELIQAYNDSSSLVTDIAVKGTEMGVERNEARAEVLELRQRVWELEEQLWGRR
ncbi:hypothetical protein B0J14DRAFT_698822 [Halenospora varia]|nr:hypothetical protein B0J14DRAFT_698822 [Halenospora varia]